MRGRATGGESVEEVMVVERQAATEVWHTRSHERTLEREKPRQKRVTEIIVHE